MSKRLDGKVAIVTGAGAGLGRGIAQELAEAGAHIAVLEIDPASSEQAAAELTRAGVTARSYPTDVAQSDQVDGAFDAVMGDFGRLDIVVNNAGISRVGPFTQDVTDEDWHESIAVMQTGVFFCTRAAGRVMLERGKGAVVNIASIRGHSPNPGRLAYCAAKAAVLMMTQVTAGEWAGRGVRVNAVSPGPQRTSMWERDVARGVLDDAFYERVIPAGRIGDPHEVARLCAFLASDDAGYITGATLSANGGQVMV
jgi:3-oxoacyl-[acyl-carrier protein] reductase